MGRGWILAFFEGGCRCSKGSGGTEMEVKAGSPKKKRRDEKVQDKEGNGGSGTKGKGGKCARAKYRLALTK